MENVQSAIRALQRLGLTEYEARCFVALVRLPQGTAKEIAKVADIPRSRVYGTMDHLRSKGLVTVQESDPRTYQSVSLDSAMRILRNEYGEYLDTVENTLADVEPVYKETKGAVWAVANHEQVRALVCDLLGRASDEIVFIVLAEGLVEDDVRAELAEASDRGVEINVGTTVDAVHERLETGEIDATIFTSGLIEWFTATSKPSRIGRLLMIDREPVLLSALHEEELPGVPNETAVWSDGVDHGFALFMERILTYELQENVAEAYDETHAE